MIKQAIKISCILLFLLSQLQAQAKLESFERAYFGFVLEGSLLAPWQMEPSPDPQVQFQGRINPSHIHSLRMLYNISDRFFASFQAGIGLAYFRNKISFRDGTGLLLKHSPFGLGSMYTQIQFGLQYRFLPQASWSPYISMGLSVFKGRYNRLEAGNAGSRSMAAPSGSSPPPSNTQNPNALYYLGTAFSTSMKALSFGLGISKKLRNRKQLLLLELRYQHSRDNYLDAYYSFPYYGYQGALRATLSQLSFSVSYLFS